MNIGLIGLGKMGYQLALNMLDQHIDFIAYNRTHHKLDKIQKEGVNVAYSLEELVKALKPPRIVWLMIPAGDPIDETIEQLLPLLNAGDTLIDGGNSNYKDTVRRYETLKQHTINFLDIGTSGGVEGARNRACMMVGGDKNAYDALKPTLQKLCAEDGFDYMGPSGAGHYVKMIHNAIEYVILQGFAEGFELLNAGQYTLDFEKVAKVWNHGSILEGRLMGLAEKIFNEDPELDTSEDVVEPTAEATWTLEEALSLGIPAHALADALFVRYRSHGKHAFSMRLITALRKSFGEQTVKSK